MSELATIVSQALETLTQRFRANPADFLYESDLRSALFALLDSSLPAIRVRSIEAGVDAQITPVKTEYPSKQRFDIAVLDPTVTDPVDHYPRLIQCGEPMVVL